MGKSLSHSYLFLQACAGSVHLMIENPAAGEVLEIEVFRSNADPFLKGRYEFDAVDAGAGMVFDSGAYTRGNLTIVLISELRDAFPVCQAAEVTKCTAPSSEVIAAKHEARSPRLPRPPPAAALPAKALTSTPRKKQWLSSRSRSRHSSLSQHRSERGSPTASASRTAQTKQRLKIAPNMVFDQEVALRAYEEVCELPEGTATLPQVVATSAGVEGFATSEIGARIRRRLEGML